MSDCKGQIQRSNAKPFQAFGVTIYLYHSLPGCPDLQIPLREDLERDMCKFMNLSVCVCRGGGGSTQTLLLYL